LIYGKSWLASYKGSANKMSELFDGLQTDEFEKMVETFIDQEDPDAISPTALDEAACLELEKVATTSVELTDVIQEGKIIFDTPRDAPIVVDGNELVIGGLRLIVNLRPTFQSS
jgi:hypothetical protein